MLNKTRGEAVQGPRAQIDREKYKLSISRVINESGVEVIEERLLTYLQKRKTLKNMLLE